MEQNNWKPGDIAVCIKTGYLSYQNPDKGRDLPPLRLKAEYLVNSVRVCECGSVTLDVGLLNDSGRGMQCKCGATSSPHSGIHWCASERFVRKGIEETKSVEEKIKEALSVENYELADELQKGVH